ncbi:hypothetical protein BDY17DRAFT_324622 [Neohortaea acidophila]|uniref:Uncharacterized protein n=1 Tax=Neohortaea acidophila TaxID=245834 RepID=A0A6A6PS78_9PEZI|nr:uncharacterized protein BDY17DRAFT_324622 [Neohortaea acidophila]KAF2482333.1 hypothetical protein BDY17DRAFT_324622 [Neohortaea acidophila]
MSAVPRIDDRLLWLGFGIFLFSAAKGIQYAIHDIVELTELTPLPDAFENPKGDLPEDKMSLENLKILADSPDYHISTAAAEIVVERIVRQPEAIRSIVNDATQSEDKQLQAHARQALSFLRPFRNARRYAEVRRNWEPYPEFGEHSGNSTPSVHPVPEHVRAAFASLQDLRAERAAFSSLQDLQAAGDRAAFESLQELRAERDARMQGSLDEPLLVPSEENPVAGWTNVPRERSGTRGEDEAGRRRRRREAMVLREGDGGAVEDDIIRFHEDG